jgi:hypothetical protein
MAARDHSLIFIGGLHRSGTSLLHEILRSHPAVSGFRNTGVPEDEGQHLQSVYPPAKRFGGPGRFCFEEAAYMDEGHPLATPANAEKLFAQWRRYWDTTRHYLVEKSPPNLIRARFLQSLFPTASFVMMLRHPIVVALATQKWGKTSTLNLLEHSLVCYERFLEDLPHIRQAYVLRYEELVADPRLQVARLLQWLGLESFDFVNEVRPDANDKYLERWESTRDAVFGLCGAAEIQEYERRTNALGYSLIDTAKRF